MVWRAMTRSARGLADSARFSDGTPTSVPGWSVGLASASHSSSRLESVCFTTSPSHSMIRRPPRCVRTWVRSSAVPGRHR